MPDIGNMFGGVGNLGGSLMSSLVFMVSVVAVFGAPLILYLILRYLDVWPAAPRYPITLCLLKKHGQQSPKLFTTRARIRTFKGEDGSAIDWLVTKKIGGRNLILPLFKSDQNISDDFMLYFMQGKSTGTNIRGNVYPTLVKKWEVVDWRPVGLESVMLEDERAMITSAVATDGSGIVCPAVVSDTRMVVFPKTIELELLTDDSILPEYYRLHKMNAKRFTYQDFLGKYGMLIGLGFVAIALFVILISNLKLADALKDGVKVAVENVYTGGGGAVPPATTIPPSPPPLTR